MKIKNKLKRELTVSFSKMSTKISFFLSFLLSSLEMGFWMAVDEIVLCLNIFGINETFFFYCASAWTKIGSLTIKGLIASVVTSWGCPKSMISSMIS